MKRRCLLLIGILTLSACTFGGLNTIREGIPFLASTATSTPPPTPSWTPSPVPSPTPVPRLFETGQQVYLVPELVDAVFGPFKLGRNLHYMQVSELHCSDYDSYQQSEVWVFHGQKATIQDSISCGEDVFYKAAVDRWVYADAEHLWVKENQLSEEFPFLNYPFVFSYATDSEEDPGHSPYTAYFPEEHILGKGQTGVSTIGGQLVQVTLNGVEEILQDESKFYRYVSTIFTIQNDGTETLEFNSKDLIQARANALEVISNPTAKLVQRDPNDVSILPGESAEIEIVWKFTRTRYSNHDLAVYIAVNNPIEDNLYVFIMENSLFFRDELPWNN